MTKTSPATIFFWGAVLSAAVPGASGQEPASVRIYEAPRASAPPVIDGDLTDPAWQPAPWTEPFLDIRSDDWPAPIWTTRAKIAWDDAHLYIAAELEEPHLWATLADRDAILYREHDFEVFLDPDGDALAYYELEINALGTEFDLFLDRPYQRRGKANIGWDMAGLRTAVLLDGTLNDPSDDDVGWSVEIAIPWSALTPPDDFRSNGGGETAVRDTAGVPTPISHPFRHGAPPRPGDTWRMNFSRVQWPLEVVDGEYRRARVPTPEDRHPEHNWVWSPQGEINMHIPERWGVVRFVAGTVQALSRAAAPRTAATVTRVHRRPPPRRPSPHGPGCTATATTTRPNGAAASLDCGTRASMPYWSAAETSHWSPEPPAPRGSSSIAGSGL